MSKHQNWENGSFEEFIRKSVEDLPLEFDPQAWEAMEKKLDAGAGRTTHAGNAGKIGGGLAALLVMSLLGWYLLSGTENNADMVAERQANEQLSDPEPGDGTASTGLQEQERIPEAEEVEQQESVPAGSGHSLGIIRSADKVYLNPREDHLDVKRNGSASASSGPGNGAPAESIKNAATAAGKGLQKMPWQDFIFEDRKILQLREVVQDRRVTEGTQPEEVTEPLLDTALPLSLSLSLTPDFSGMGKGGSARLGAAAGFHLAYRVLPRLGLVTGLVYSQKNYLANSSYSPYDFGHYYPSPDHINASCDVLDIPLNLRYYLVQRKRHAFFLSSGLSSYLMKREDYTMVYADEQYDNFTYELRNENSHYFAVYNFSAGYEARISPRWAIQAEPFLKIPARGLGAGSIRLNSMGAFLHLKYQIGRLGN